MKILIINYEFPPVGGGGGYASYHLAKELVQYGHMVTVLTSKYKEEPDHQSVDGVDLVRVQSWRKGIHDSGFRGASSFLIFAAPALRQLLANTKFDIVHIFFALPTGLLSLMLRGKYRVPFILSLRGSDVPDYDPHNRAVQIFHKLLKPISNFLIRKAAFVIPVTNSLGDLARMAWGDRIDPAIPNGVDRVFIDHQGSYAVRSGGVFRLILVSRLIKRKGVQKVISAIKTMNSSSLSLTVVGDGNFKDRLISDVNANGMSSVVTFLGYVPKEDLPELMGQHHAFICTPDSEAFGNVFAEALAIGLPIIASRVGGIVDIVGEQNGILLDTISDETISKAIICLMNDQDMCNRMFVSNRKKAKENYQWKNVAARYIDKYQGAI